MITPEILNYRITVQKWEESERGWGTRPDGFSLHLNQADRESFIKGYWDSMPDSVRDEYSRPDGTPYTAEVDLETFINISESKNGLRRRGNPPGSGGIDGWVSAKS